MGTRSKSIEAYMKKEKSWKHLIFVLNKCDLIPTWVTVRNLQHVHLWLDVIVCLLVVLKLCDSCFVLNQKRWVAVLSQEYPTLAFHASLTNSFGKGSLIQLLRQFGKVRTCLKLKISLICHESVLSNLSNLFFCNRTISLFFLRPWIFKLHPF